MNSIKIKINFHRLPPVVNLGITAPQPVLNKEHQLVNPIYIIKGRTKVSRGIGVRHGD